MPQPKRKKETEKEKEKTKSSDMAITHLTCPSSHVFRHPGPACSVSDMHATQKKKEKGEEDIPSEPIHGLHATASPKPVVSLWVEEGGQSHADHRPRAENCVRDMGGQCT